MFIQKIICICSIALIVIVLANITSHLVNGSSWDVNLLLKAGLAGCACIVIWRVDPTYLRIAGRAAAASLICPADLAILEDYQGEPSEKERKRRVLMIMIGMALLFLSCRD